jgi:rSAM/selenodomain-associated transferase 2
MQPRLAVVIPALNEELRIASAIRSAREACADEIIVSDGGSSDRTVEIAQAAGAVVVSGEPMRARQMNAGAARASSEHIVFLHGDTELPRDAKSVIADALRQAEFGGFQLEFAEPSARLRIVATLANLRTRFTRCPWGDQAQFIRREDFERSGGFREIELMEDYELAVRMKRSGRSVVVRSKVRTSGRRFLEKGILRTTFINWKIVLMYRSGVDTATLRKIYRGE